MISTVRLFNVRVTYKQVPVHALEMFIVKDTDHMYSMLKEYYDECFILQTCNRVEFYAVSTNDKDESYIISKWAESICMDALELGKSIIVSKDDDVIMHLFRLSCGLDSLIVGEDQILAQIKRAYEHAKKSNAIGMYLTLILDKAIRVGSKVRMSTDIGKGSISYGSIAVRLAEEYANGLEGKSIILIGSGEGASMIAKALINRGIDFMVTSRTIERAKAFADTIGGKPVCFDDAMLMLDRVDVLFIATIAPYYLLTYERLKHLVDLRVKRGKGQLIIVDISNPSTVEPKVAELPSIRLVRFDEIAGIVERNKSIRMSKVNEAESIVKQEVDLMIQRLRRFEVEPMIDSLFRRIDAIRKRELDKALNMLNGLSEEQKRVIEQMSYAIVESILSIPMDELRKASEHGDSELIKVATRLFRYEDR
jgi:glutamyl-tRNA reductase